MLSLRLFSLSQNWGPVISTCTVIMWACRTCTNADYLKQKRFFCYTYPSLPLGLSNYYNFYPCHSGYYTRSCKNVCRRIFRGLPSSSCLLCITQPYCLRSLIPPFPLLTKENGGRRRRRRILNVQVNNDTLPPTHMNITSNLLLLLLIS